MHVRRAGGPVPRALLPLRLQRLLLRKRPATRRGAVAAKAEARRSGLGAREAGEQAERRRRSGGRVEGEGQPGLGGRSAVGRALEGFAVYWWRHFGLPAQGEPVPGRGAGVAVFVVRGFGHSGGARTGVGCYIEPVFETYPPSILSTGICSPPAVAGGNHVCGSANTLQTTARTVPCRIETSTNCILMWLTSAMRGIRRYLLEVEYLVARGRVWEGSGWGWW